MANVFLKALAQIVPNHAGVEGLSKLDPPVVMSDKDFGGYADTAKGQAVSFEDDGISNPENTTVYTLPSSNGVPGRYVVSDASDNSPPTEGDTPD